MLSHPDLTDRHLLVFAFEDYLKRWFFNLLQVLEVSQVNIPQFRHRLMPRSCLTIHYHMFECRDCTSFSSFFRAMPSKSRICCDWVSTSS
jgi:hypothetical protein